MPPGSAHSCGTGPVSRLSFRLSSCSCRSLLQAAGSEPLRLLLSACSVTSVTRPTGLLPLATVPVPAAAGSVLAEAPEPHTEGSVPLRLLPSRFLQP